jgi:restriction endonuclease S subunit
LFYILNSDNFEHDAIVNSSGVAQLNLSTKWVENYKIPLPPLYEQKKIAAILDAADALRQKDAQLIAKYNALSQSLFLDMFGDPVTNPMGWELSRIDALCRIVRGSSPRPKGDPRYYGGNVPRLMVADLTRDGKRVTPRIDNLTEEGAKKSRPTKSGTVVMAVSGNVGLTSILAVDACIHDGFIAFNELNTSKILPSFFVDLMMFLKSTHASRQAGAIFKNLTTAQMKEMEVPLPSITLQNQFAERIQAIEAQKQQAQVALQKSEDLFNSLLQRAFKGELTT